MRVKGLSKKGFILVSVVLFVLVIMIFVVPSVDWAVNEYGWTTHSYELLEALNLADAGAERAIWEIAYNGAAFGGWAGTGPWAMAMDSFQDDYGNVIGDIAVNCDNYQPSKYLITSAGHVPGKITPRAIKIVKVLVFPHPLFNNGIFAYDTLTLKGNSIVDSYDASMGAYSPLAAGSEADIGTNGTLSLAPGVSVNGDVFVNQDGTWAGVTDANVTGELYVTAEKVDVVPVPIVTDLIVLASQGNFMATGSDNIMFPSGDYRFERITVQGQATLTFSANTRIYVDNDFSIAGSASVFTGSNCKFYFNEDVSAAGGGIINTAGNPADLQMYGVGTSQTFQYSGGSDFYGAIFAPGATVTVTGTAGVYGSIIADDVELSGTNSFHFDENLKNSGPTEGYEIVYWQEN